MRRFGSVAVLTLLATLWALPATASVAAALTIKASPSTINEGGSITLDGDLDSNCRNGASVHVDWGDGTSSDFSTAGVGPIPQQTHTYTDDDNNPPGVPPGTYPITAALQPSQGCQDQASGQTQVTVNNVAPSQLTLQNTSPINAGSSTTLNGTFADPGADTHIVDIDWGDGTAVDHLNLPLSQTTFNTTHPYANAGSFTIHVTVTDDDKAAVSGTTPQVVVAKPENRWITGAGAGGGPHVKVFQGATDTQPVQNLFCFGRAFHGGVRVATGDVNGDGISDIICGAGPGGGPHVKVLNGMDGSVLQSFFAFSPSFMGGVWVAAGDVNGDGKADIIVGADAGGGPQVNVYDGANGKLLDSFFAFSPSFTGGVRVATGDVNGDGISDIIVGAGAGGGPHVKVFDGKNLNVLASFFAFSPSFTGGVFVAAGDLNGDGKADIIVGAGAGGGPHVKVFDGANGNTLDSFFAFSASFTGGVYVAAADVNGDGKADIIVGAGAGGGPHVKVFDGNTLNVLRSFFAFAPSFAGGVYVGGEGGTLQHP
jgi:hypothetical protein